MPRPRDLLAGGPLVMSLKMALVGVQIKHFKSALQCLGRIGETLFMHAAGAASSRSQPVILSTPLLVQGRSSSSRRYLRRCTCLIHAVSCQCIVKAVGSRSCSARG